MGAGRAAELAFTGGAAALLTGIGVQVGAVVGAVVAGLVFGVLGLRQRERDSVIGVVLAFGLGLGVLMLALYPGRASNKFGLLTGSIVSIDATNLWVLGAVAVIVIAVVAVLHRQLLFASADAEVATARGVPVRLLSLVFAVLIGLVTALAVPIVGAILVLSVMIAPGAAAARVTANPLLATALAVMFAAAFWSVDSFTSNLVKVANLDNFRVLLHDSVYRTVALRTLGVDVPGEIVVLVGVALVQLVALVPLRRLAAKAL